MLRICCYCLLLGLPSLSASWLKASAQSPFRRKEQPAQIEGSCEQQQSMLDKTVHSIMMLQCSALHCCIIHRL